MDEKEKQSDKDKNGGYDLFTYLDYTQSYPLDDSDFKKTPQKPEVAKTTGHETFFEQQNKQNEPAAEPKHDEIVEQISIVDSEKTTEKEVKQ